MKWEVVTELTRKAVAQALGTEYMEQSGVISGLDTAKLIDIGKSVLDSGQGGTAREGHWPADTNATHGSV